MSKKIDVGQYFKKRYEIAEIIKEFEKVGGELESRVGEEWEDDEECFKGKFAKRYLDI